ncbi:hypothetical protein K661_01085 [Piscirickettsia salmonis LF-89 = ATCC VR-1361]|nr:hypothetical protein K661_01085 [Piscirickettsia salmonis LF-89 = ATCC VR-1361]
MDDWMKFIQRSEVILSAYFVDRDGQGDTFEFALNDKLKVISGACQDFVTGKMHSVQVKDYWDTLFEFNYISIQSKISSSATIRRFTELLNQFGIRLAPPEDAYDETLDFNLLGELPDIVRFYIRPNNEIIFLSPASRFKLVAC